MREAETVLGVLRERGRRGLPVERLYRLLFNPRLYLLAYQRLYANSGAMTAGVTGETVDGMSPDKIRRIVAVVRTEQWRWMPVKRIYIPKRDGKRRALGLPSFSDELLAEVIRMLLNAYYDVQFSDRSHGFRPGRVATPRWVRWSMSGTEHTGLLRVISLNVSTRLIIR
jgi:retron-type reverse transcriptase